MGTNSGPHEESIFQCHPWQCNLNLGHLAPHRKQNTTNLKLHYKSIESAQNLDMMHIAPFWGEWFAKTTARRRHKFARSFFSDVKANFIFCIYGWQSSSFSLKGCIYYCSVSLIKWHCAERRGTCLDSFFFLIDPFLKCLKH